MQFQTKAQKQCYERIHPVIKELFGEFFRERDDVPAFGVVIGSALVEMAIHPWTEDESVISAWSWVVTGAEISPDLLRFLLEENMGMRFGAFAIDSSGDIMFRDTIVGSSCDKKELEHLVKAVMVTADKYDDEIISRWGGQRAVDRMK